LHFIQGIEGKVQLLLEGSSPIIALLQELEVTKKNKTIAYITDIDIYKDLQFYGLPMDFFPKVLNFFLLITSI
jgi:hypothetical protein